MISRDLFSKIKSDIKLSTRQDGDGNEVEVEVRENEEQFLKFQEIVNLLVAAGYFRARIKGLSPFDRVVGGMTWCIESCNFDVDVDLLFQENSSIGQKIALTEKIVSVLPKMKCPYIIEPHQIQGLDFINVFPVIQWLVKRSMEFRQETFEVLRFNAINQYNKMYTVEKEQSDKVTNEKLKSNMQVIRNVYRPQRQYKLKQDPPENEYDRVQITVLEYGFRYPLNLSNVTSPDPSIPPEIMEEQKTEQLRVETLFKSLMLMDDKDDFEKLDPEEKLELFNHYSALQSELQDGGIRSREKKQLATLKTEQILLEKKYSKVKSKTEQVNESLKKELESIAELRSKKEEAENHFQQVQIDNSDEESDLKKLEQLILLNETLREQEKQFKEQCRIEMERLQKNIENVQNTDNSGKNTDLLEKLSEKGNEVQNIRSKLAQKNRDIAALQRKLDETPSRAELAQYQRRFLELYNQVAGKHKETKQYYTLYNTLEDTKTYLTKELTLLNSILDSYPEAISSAAGKEEFIKQFESIVEGVKQSKSKVTDQYKRELVNRDDLSQQLMILIEQQRKYVAAVKQLSVECKKNEILNSQINQMNI